VAALKKLKFAKEELASIDKIIGQS
jgi:hypothetical protein